VRRFIKYKKFDTQRIFQGSIGNDIMNISGLWYSSNAADGLDAIVVVSYFNNRIHFRVT
jgi:hypothetical protein